MIKVAIAGLCVSAIMVVLLIFTLSKLNIVRHQLDVKVRTCSSFDSYQEALRSLAGGNTNIDRDRDGRPCEGTHY